MRMVYMNFVLKVLVKGDSDLMGKMVEVEIYETGKHFMKAKLVDNAEIINPGLKSPLQKGQVSGAPIVSPEKVCDQLFEFDFCLLFI